MRPDPQRLIDRREFPILYVDDERENLRAFELSFRREFEVLTARSGIEALGIINARPVSVVLSDHRMPEMTGTEFLARVRSLDPHTVRLLVTAYGDAATLADAINSGSIYRYIPKPWDTDEMRVALCQSIDLYALESERDTLVSELTTLHAASRVLLRESDPQGIMQAAGRTVVDDLGFDALTILVKDEQSNRLCAKLNEPSNGVAGEFLRSFSVELSEAGTWMSSVRAGHTELLRLEQVADAGVSARRLVTEIAADEVLSVPLASAGVIRGVMLVDNRRGGRHFRAAERMLLEGLAAQVSTALQCAGVASQEPDGAIQNAMFSELTQYGAVSIRLLDGAQPDVVSDLLSDISSTHNQEHTLDVGACIARVVSEFVPSESRLRLKVAKAGVGPGKLRLSRTVVESVVALVLSECLSWSPLGDIVVAAETPTEVTISARGSIEGGVDSLRLSAAGALIQRGGGRITIRPGSEMGKATVVLNLY